MKEKQIEEKWNKKVSVLIGKRISGAFYMSEKVANEFGWHKRPLVIRFTDGTEIVLSSDDEGNDGGSAFTNIEGLETIPTL